MVPWLVPRRGPYFLESHLVGDLPVATISRERGREGAGSCEQSRAGLSLLSGQRGFLRPGPERRWPSTGGRDGTRLSQAMRGAGASRARRGRALMEREDRGGRRGPWVTAGTGGTAGTAGDSRAGAGTGTRQHEAPSQHEAPAESGPGVTPCVTPCVLRSPVCPDCHSARFSSSARKTLVFLSRSGAQGLIPALRDR